MQSVYPRPTLDLSDSIDRFCVGERDFQVVKADMTTGFSVSRNVSDKTAFRRKSVAADQTKIGSRCQHERASHSESARLNGQRCLCSLGVV